MHGYRSRGYSLNINTSRKHIGGNEDFSMTLPEPVDDFVTLGRAEVSSDAYTVVSF